MRQRGATVLGVLAVFVASLVLTSMAEARAGGGGSIGSRGSRSYSAPVKPSTPSSPAAPRPGDPQRGIGPAQPQRSLFGGWGGMLGGLLLGGLLGSLLFGGLGHGLFGGIGLLEILLIVGLAYLAVKLLRRREPQPAMAGGPGGATPWRASDVSRSTEPARSQMVHVAGSAATDLHGGVEAIRMMDRSFDPARFAATVAREIFVRVQSAWTARDLSSVRAQLTDEMAAGLEDDLARLRALRRTNRVEGVSVDAVETTEAWQELGRDYVTVRIAARALDYTVDESAGAVMEGSNSAPASFEEFWTFTRPVGQSAWRLSAIQQPVA